MASVSFDHVTKQFDGVTAVDELSLDVNDGEFLVLLGPSGCGKTTALRMIAGLEDITEGELRIGGSRVNEIDPRKRDISMVFQSYALYPHLTVAKNIASPLSVREYVVEGAAQPRKLTKDEQRARVAEAAGMLGLEPYLDRKPGALSGGQRQRVALARAIVARPQVFLMDEPLSNLDAKLRTQTRAELVDLHRRLGTTIVYVTHDQVEAMTMATRIAVMAEGQLQQVGSSEEVYDRPANLFVARFIGTPPMNTFSAVVAADGKHLSVTEAEPNPDLDNPIERTGTSGEAGEAGTLDLAADQQTLVAPGRSLVVGIRPEHLAIAADASGAVSSGLRGTVRNVEWLGHEAVVSVAVAGSPIAVRQAADVPLQAVGATVVLEPVAGRLHLFDPDTTARLT